MLPLHAGLPPAITLTEAYALLGLREGSAYEEVLAAKNALLARSGDDSEKQLQVGRNGMPLLLICQYAWFHASRNSVWRRAEQS
jgi:hypothetical protein